MGDQGECKIVHVRNVHVLFLGFVQTLGLGNPWFAHRIPVGLGVISMVSVLSVLAIKPALNPLFVDV